jgi:hypothetical protein
MASADETIRRGVDELAVFDFDVTPCSSAPPLSEARGGDRDHRGAAFGWGTELGDR